MNVIRIREPDALRPLHVVMLCLVTMTVAGGSLLISTPKSQTLPDGAVEWRVDSPLRAVVQLLCLDYQFPTTDRGIGAGAVKTYVLGIGAGLAILALSVAILVRGRTGDEEATAEDEQVEAASAASSATGSIPEKTHVAPLVAAQVLIGLYLLWSFASSRWSSAPELAIGGSVLLTIHFLWALSIGHGLSPTAARVASRIIVGVAAVTSLVAIWYFYGRNPGLPASFPFGNPIFLGACLIPGIVLAITWICERTGALARAQRALPVIAILAVLTVGLWAFSLADKRGPTVGLLFGVLAVIFFAVPKRFKWIPLLIALSATWYGYDYLSTARVSSAPSASTATLRFRMYAWSYAWQMFNEKPVTGHGQGGFVLAGDSHAAGDVLGDPLVFESRIAHAHNEWLEVLADLGSVGIVLLAASLLFTLRAGMLALDASRSRGHRLALIGLMSALIGLCAEESFGVGLRVSGVPTLFYTVLGLTWALSAQGPLALVACLSKTPARRITTGVVGVSLGLSALGLTQQDFAAARDEYRAQSALQEGDHEQAIRLATRAISRLNPQRALANLFRLAEAHTLVAKRLQERADDREARARANDFADPQLLALAGQDRAQSERHCLEGSRTLKELVSRSPGFLNHGWVSYWLNRTQAVNAHARGDIDQRDQFRKDAQAALLRELERQPFHPTITLEYLSVAGSALELTSAMDRLARVLRHKRITKPFVDLLTRFASTPGFDERFDAIIQQARAALTAAPAPEDAEKAPETWAPEKLRLAATLHFLGGEYGQARGILEPAAAAYDALALSAPIGAAAYYAELADCRFFSDPNDPGAAIASAARALSLAPESGAGRTLKDSVEQRMIHYLLAGNNEEEVLRLLRKSGPSNVSQEALLTELGVRYRLLSESLLQRREALFFRKSPGDLLPKLSGWMRRALELNPNDGQACFVAADLAFHTGDCEGAAAHLARALDVGLGKDVAERFIRMALHKGPQCAALADLLQALSVPQPGDQPAPEQAPSLPD